MKSARTTSRTRTPRATKDGKAARPAVKAKTPVRRKSNVVARVVARARAPRPIARLLRLTDPRAALESLIETKGVVKTVESGTVEPKPSAKGHDRFTFAKIPHTLDIPDLIELQKESFHWFITEGLREAFASISPIKDFTGNLVLEFGEHSLGEPKYSVEECRERDMTYCAPLRVRVRLITSESGEIKGIPDQEIFMGDLPLMTDKGTFMINGAERVIVSQLVRSPGVYFQQETDTNGRPIFGATVIPNRGAWIEFETDNGGKNDTTEGTIGVRIDKNRKIIVTTFIRALDKKYESDEAIKKLFADPLTGETPAIILNCIEKDKDITTREDALREVYKKLRPGEPENPDNAETLLRNTFFDDKRYDLAAVGRYKVNRKLEKQFALMNYEAPRVDDTKDGHGRVKEKALRHLTKEDMLAVVRHLVEVVNGTQHVDDIDHLGNRRVRSVGELLQNQFRVGLLRLERVVRERMTVQDLETVTPQVLINIRPVVAAIKEFFGSSQLSQFMDQTNSLAELTHKRRLSALGPGGLSRERAGFEVRDVHHSHYGRICPIETPEGPNIGLIGSLATYAKVNRYGFIETPYRIVRKGTVTDDIIYLTADEEDQFRIAQANSLLDSKNRLTEEMVTCRYAEEYIESAPQDVHLMDVSPKQIVSVATALIPFLEHDDANRALMGANMQRQAVPLLVPDPPLIGTGMEHRAAKDSGGVVVAEEAGEVVGVTADRIEVRNAKGVVRNYALLKYTRSNAGTCINQAPIVRKGDHVKKDAIIADGPSSSGGELSLGQNVLVAFMPWEGYNYEDAILISEKLIKEDRFTSIHIEEYECEARDTKLGPEEITRDIPNVGEDALQDLDEQGIVRIGAEVRPEDILVGKVTPKGETELTAEERLLRAIFGEKSREVRDTSLKVPHGEKGKVIDVKVFKRENGDELSPGVNELVRVYVAQKRKIMQGDKMAGRHGNKGVIAKVLPEEDMPYLPDGTPVEIVLNPLGVPSRMNVGQIMETHLGWAAKLLGSYIATPVFDGAREADIHAWLERAKLPSTGKSLLYDGRTGEPFNRDITVGQIYMMKLAHLVDDKIHARSTGPYSMITQQPLGGKAQFGGQRFGEMEVWALEAYGAAYTLQELLTVKSDDVVGRVKTYEAIVKGENVLEPGVPESFKVLIKELQSLALDVKVLTENREEIEIRLTDEDVNEKASEIGLLMGDEEPKLVAPAPTTAASRPRRAGSEGDAEEAEALAAATSTVVVEPETEEEDEDTLGAEEPVESPAETGLGSIEDIEP